MGCDTMSHRFPVDTAKITVYCQLVNRNARTNVSGMEDRNIKRPRNWEKKGLDPSLTPAQMHLVLERRREEHARDRQAYFAARTEERAELERKQARDRYVREKEEKEAAARPAPVIPDEPEEVIDARIAERFDILTTFTRGAAEGTVRAIIASGPPGLGKSYSIETELARIDPGKKRHSFIKGYVRPLGLYKALWDHREPGRVIVFDDADSIFHEELALNMLKAVCDTTENRIVSYLSDYNNLTSDTTGSPIPKQYEFRGTVIFITNYDFDAIVEKGQNKLIPHLQALMSRAHYIDLSMRTRRDYIVRIKQVVREGMMQKAGLSKEMEMEVMGFIEEKAQYLREISLRMAVKLAGIRLLHRDDWQRYAVITCCRQH